MSLPWICSLSICSFCFPEETYRGEYLHIYIRKGLMKMKKSITSVQLKCHYNVSTVFDVFSFATTAGIWNLWSRKSSELLREGKRGGLRKTFSFWSQAVLLGWSVLAEQSFTPNCCSPKDFKLPPWWLSMKLSLSVFPFRILHTVFQPLSDGLLINTPHFHRAYREKKKKKSQEKTPFLPHSVQLVCLSGCTSAR